MSSWGGGERGQKEGLPRVVQTEGNRGCKGPVWQIKRGKGYCGDALRAYWGPEGTRLGRCSLARASGACHENVGQVSVCTGVL